MPGQFGTDSTIELCEMSKKRSRQLDDIGSSKRCKYQEYETEDDSVYYDIYGDWDLKLETRDRTKCLKLLTRYHSCVEDDLPSIKKILINKLPDALKVYLLKLYSMMMSPNVPPYSDEYYRLGEQITQVCNLTKREGENYLTMLGENSALSTICNAKNRVAFGLWHDAQEIKYKSIGETSHLNQKIQLQLINKSSIISDTGISIYDQIDQLETTTVNKKAIYDIYLKSTKNDSSNAALNKERLNIALKLPYDRNRPLLVDDQSIHDHLTKIKTKLDEKIWKATATKEKILAIVNSRIRNPKSHCILALTGKAGVGKTRIAQILAEALNLPFSKIDMGGQNNAAILKGSAPVWVGAAPGLLLESMATHGINNGVILIDEVDKLSNSAHGTEVQHALLHILDPSQNKEFVSDYLPGITQDLSNVWFILSMNDKQSISPILRDRLEIVEMPAYSKEDLQVIIKDYVLPEICDEQGVARSDLTISTAGCNAIFQALNVQDGQGVRVCQKAIRDIVYKILLYRNFKDLSYKIPDFNGLPYVIERTTVERLVHRTSDPRPSYYT